jgi:hypothetical protein
MGLFTPWMSKDRPRAENAIGNLNDQKKIAEAALKAPLETTRAIAVKKLTDQEVIAKIAATDSSVYVRTEAIIKCDYSKIYRNKASQFARKAMEEISDDNMLFKIAAEATSLFARMNASERIMNVELLKKLIMTEKDHQVCRNTAQHLAKITADPNTLYFCFRRDPYWNKDIFDKIDDLALLEKNILEDADEKCRARIAELAMSRLSNASLLSFALRTDNLKYVRCLVAVELMKRDSSHYSQPLASLISGCLRNDNAYYLMELDDPRVVPALERLIDRKDFHQYREVCDRFRDIRTKASVEALLRIMEKSRRAAPFAQQALMEMYREAKDDAVREAILVIPRRIYHAHDDYREDRCSPHEDKAKVHFDLPV